jgi:plasmid maintenance system antidote protein VapI
VAEVCLIGLAAFFEAFCKDQFASIINICPETLSRFVAKRNTVTVELADLLLILPTTSRLGFVLAEKYDFGSAKEVNSLYSDLLGVPVPKV